MRSPRALAAASASRASAGDNRQTPISHRPAAEPHAARLGANGNALAGIRKLKDGQGNYLWQPSFTEGQAQNVLAYPGTDGRDARCRPRRHALAFGDFRRGYLILDRTRVRVLRDPFTNKPYVHFCTTKRVGGALLDAHGVADP